MLLLNHNILISQKSHKAWIDRLRPVRLYRGIGDSWVVVRPREKRRTRRSPLQRDDVRTGHVGADRCVGPSLDDDGGQGAHTGAPVRNDSDQHGPDLLQVIQWFKTMTTNAYIRGVEDDNWEPFLGKLRHRSFYDRIIRNESELKRIREYILTNPANWDGDRENPESGEKDGGLKC